MARVCGRLCAPYGKAIGAKTNGKHHPEHHRAASHSQRFCWQCLVVLRLLPVGSTRSFVSSLAVGAVSAHGLFFLTACRFRLMAVSARRRCSRLFCLGKTGTE